MSFEILRPYCVLGAREVKAALKRYADRLMYQKRLGNGQLSFCPVSCGIFRN
jgi:hypothetical protein